MEKIKKRINTHDTVGTILQYFEEHPKKIRKVFISRRCTYRKDVAVISFTYFL